MAGREKMTSVAATPSPSRRLSVSTAGGSGPRGTKAAFEFTMPRQVRPRASSERSSRSSTPVRGSRGASPAPEPKRRTPSRPSTPQTLKKKRNNELERLLIAAVNDGQRRAPLLSDDAKKAAAAKKKKKKAVVPTSPAKKAAVGAKKALDKAKKVVPVKTKAKPLVKSQIKKAKAKVVVKKKVVQLRKPVAPSKKTEAKTKAVETKKSEEVSKKVDTPKAASKESTKPAAKEEKNKAEEKEEPSPTPPPPAAKELSKASTPSVPEQLPPTKSTKERKNSSVEPPKSPMEAPDPIKELKEALKESLLSPKEPKAEAEEASKASEASKSVGARREEAKPKVDVMQTLTEACRKLEQLKSKKKESPTPSEVAPRSPEGAAMTTEKPIPENVVEKALKPSSVISPVNLQAKLRNKLSQSPSTEAKEGTMALTLPSMTTSAAPIINSLSAAAKQTSSFLRDNEPPLEFRWRIDSKRLSTLAPLNACIKGKVADLLRKNPNEVVLKENKRKEPDAEDDMEELRLSESESESSGTSPDKLKNSYTEGIDRERIEQELKRIELEFERADKAEEPCAVEQELDTPVEQVEEEDKKILDKPSVKCPEVAAPIEEEMAVEEAPVLEEEVPPIPPIEEVLPPPASLPPTPAPVEEEKKVASKLSRPKREGDKKKKKRDDYRRRKLLQVKKKDRKEVVEEPMPTPVVVSCSPPSSCSPSTSSANGDGGSPRDEDMSAKESVLGALGLQSTRMAQQERPKVPKLKLVVRPTPAKKKGHRSETGNEKTYAICHEGDGEEGQKASHRKKSLWYPGLPISNGELAKLILTTPTISDLIIGRHLGEAKPPQPGIGVGDGLDTEAELGQKAPKKRDEVVIPEKTAASNVHPGRPCEDVCCYCHNKFGLFDTPLHVSQLKGGFEKQSAVLAREPVLTLASCVCDACFRHLDRPLASVSAWRPPQAKSKRPREASVCCFAGCNRPAPHPLVKRWKRRVRGLLTRGLDAKSGLFLCQQHHQETAKVGACVLCGRRAASSQLYCLERQAAEPFNEVLRQDLVPVVVRPEADLCKKCRYYSSLRLRCADYTKLSVPNRAFLRQHRQKIIKSLCPNDPSAMVEVFPEVSKPAKKLMLPPPPPPPISSTPKRTLLTPSVEIIPVPAEGPPPPKKQRGPPAPAKEAVTVRLVGAATPAAAPSTSSASRRPQVKRTARHEGPNLNFQWLGETGPPRGRWHTTRADIQMDDRTLAEWKKRQEPFGSYTSYVKHLITLDGLWRAKQLGPLPNASAACTKYCTSVRNRIEAYEGRDEDPSEDHPRICDVRSLAPH